MIALVGAELRKAGRRWATWLVLAMLLGMMAIVYALIAITGGGPRSGGAAMIVRFPAAYGVIDQFVVGLGSLLAVAWAAAMAGADWSWGTIRVILARGEGRIRYPLAKAIALGLCLVMGAIVAYAIGILLTLGAAAAQGLPAGNPLSAAGRHGLLVSVGYGIVVLLERAAIGFAIATVLRSQLAGVVAGIGLSIGEGILATVLVALQVSDGGAAAAMGHTNWHQFLPFRIGESLMAAGPGPTSNFAAMFGRPVDEPVALLVTGAYLAIALVVACIAVVRAEVA